MPPRPSADQARRGAYRKGRIVIVTSKVSRAAQKRAWAWQALYLNRQVHVPAPIEQALASRPQKKPGIASGRAQGPESRRTRPICATCSAQ